MVSTSIQKYYNLNKIKKKIDFFKIIINKFSLGKLMI